MGLGGSTLIYGKKCAWLPLSGYDSEVAFVKRRWVWNWLLIC